MPNAECDVSREARWKHKFKVREHTHHSRATYIFYLPREIYRIRMRSMSGRGMLESPPDGDGEGEEAKRDKLRKLLGVSREMRC